MNIAEEHIEWAIVHRMRSMLKKSDKKFEVTHSFAFFTAILCWVMQRIRSPGQGLVETKARSVFEQLEKEHVAAAPWSIWTDIGQPADSFKKATRSGPFADFNDFHAARFLIALRNAVAHGDARNVRPVNCGPLLIGNSFDCFEKDKARKITWHGKIILEHNDMRRIGLALADRFCLAMSESDAIGRTQFERDANQMEEKQPS